jgi:hypothetical protein
MARRRRSSPIFPNRFGEPIDAHNYRQRIFNPAAEKAGVAWATPHSLRHGLASLMADHGRTASQIASLLGHADGGVLALRTYIHAELIDTPDFIDGALATVRQKLLDRGLIYATQDYGFVDFTVPRFAEFMRRHMPFRAPSTRATNPRSKREP